MKSLLSVLLLVALLSGCSGGTTTENANAPQILTNNVVAAISINNGNNQTATVGTELPDPLVAVVLNSDGQPMPYTPINFVVKTGDGRLFNSTVNSDADGLVKQKWTLGTVAGKQTVEVNAISPNGAVIVYATFTATSTAGPLHDIAPVSGDLQQGRQLQELPFPVKIHATDVYGNAKPGVSVIFNVIGGGTIIPASTTTDDLGNAFAIWTMGINTGETMVNAVVDGFSPITFHAVTTQVINVTKISGDSQTVYQYLNIQPLKVAVMDVLGNPLKDKRVSFASNLGTNQLYSVELYTDNQGSVTWEGAFQSTGQETVTVTDIESGNFVNFTVNVVASTGTFDGKYSCGFVIVNNSISSINLPGYKPWWGTVDEATGSFQGGNRDSASCYLSLSGQLTIDLTKQVSVSGTQVSVSGTTSNCPRSSTFICNRL